MYVIVCYTITVRIGYPTYSLQQRLTIRYPVRLTALPQVYLLDYYFLN